MATNPYTSQSISGYNASPPSDDGSQASSNQVEWAKHINKIGNPLRTLAEAINSAVLAAFGSLLVTDEPAEETIMTAAAEFAGAMPQSTKIASEARLARDIEFSENAVVGMEELT